MKKCRCSFGKKVLFQNEKYSIETYLNENTNKTNLVVVIGDFETEFPIRYDNDRIAYDDPYSVPKYIKHKVYELYKTIE